MHRRTGDEKYLKDTREAYEKLPRANRGIYLSNGLRQRHAVAQLNELKDRYERDLSRIFAQHGENTSRS
ncbi:MAG: hypothetical protein LBS61_05890 [Endomicrobium sp.]|jgi:hypothetical protein|nr:hypothetical protein [Endomicrobium sp.]